MCTSCIKKKGVTQPADLWELPRWPHFEKGAFESSPPFWTDYQRWFFSVILIVDVSVDVQERMLGITPSYCALLRWMGVNRTTTILLVLWMVTWKDDTGGNVYFLKQGKHHENRDFFREAWGFCLFNRGINWRLFFFFTAMTVMWLCACSGLSSHGFGADEQFALISDKTETVQMLPVQLLHQPDSWCYTRLCSTFIIPSLLHEYSDVSIHSAKSFRWIMMGICRAGTWQGSFMQARAGRVQACFFF